MLANGGIDWGCLIGAYFISGVIIGAYCAALADEKGRSPVGHFFGGLFFGIVDLLYLIGTKDTSATSQEDPISEVRLSDEHVIELAEIIQNDISNRKVKSATKALKALGVQAKPAMPILVEVVATGKGERLVGAIDVILSIGREASSALPYLEVLLQKKDPDLWGVYDIGFCRSRLKQVIDKLKVENQAQDKQD